MYRKSTPWFVVDNKIIGGAVTALLPTARIESFKAEFGAPGVVQPQIIIKGYGEPILYDITAVYCSEPYGYCTTIATAPTLSIIPRLSPKLLTRAPECLQLL